MSFKYRFFGALVGAALLTAVATPSSAFVLGPTSPGKWGNPLLGTPGGTVTYSLMGSGITIDERNSDGVGFNGTSDLLSSFLPSGFEAQIDLAFDAWSAIADINFMKVTDSGLAFNFPEATGDIRIGGHTFDGAGGILAHGFFPPANGVSAAGDIHLDSDELWKIGFGGAGFDIFTVLTHEIGHAIGLDHELTETALMNPFYSEAFSGLKPDDIAGARFIYNIPLPAALPLFGSALAVISVLGWRRRKSAA